MLERQLRESFGLPSRIHPGGRRTRLPIFCSNPRRVIAITSPPPWLIMLRHGWDSEPNREWVSSGEFNEWSGHFVVRQSDAHSWVEAWFPGSGWVDFDPTPAAPPRTDFYLARLTSQVLDTIEVFWNEVLTFDRFKQVGFFVSLGSRLRAVSRAPPQWSVVPMTYLRISWLG